jgi:predicted N-acyltransferase
MHIYNIYIYKYLHAYKYLHTHIHIYREDWNGLLDENSSPFLEYDWIYSLEKSGCATEKMGI